MVGGLAHMIAFVVCDFGGVFVLARLKTEQKQIRNTNKAKKEVLQGQQTGKTGKK